MGKWLERAALLEARYSGDDRDNSDISSRPSSNVPIVPNVPVAASNAVRLREWRNGLAALDPGKPRAGIVSGRWHALVHDSAYLFNEWAAQAVALGWTDAALFGADPSRRPEHQVLQGLVWRCDGFKVVALSEHAAALEGKASGTPRRYYRGDTSRLLPLWRLPE